MQIHIEPTTGPAYPARLPYPHADHVITDRTCPDCGAELKVQGGTPVSEFDRYVATARCVSCGVTVGKVVAVVSTVFGIEEDNRVLNGRCRVY